MTERVLIVGPGRVGTVLAGALARSGHRIVGAAGGSAASRERFAARYAGSRTAENAVDLAGRASLIILATPDDALESVATALAVGDVLDDTYKVVHVAGAKGLAPLRRAALAGAKIAACHPAQTVPSALGSADIFLDAQWAVTAAPPDVEWASELVRDTGGTPTLVPDDARLLYHASLSIASNAVGAAVSAARQVLIAARVDDPSSFLRPLIEASVANALKEGAAALTGPVVRGDVGTVAAHLDALQTDLPELAAAYRNLSRAILGQVWPSMDPGLGAQMSEVLAEPGMERP